MSVLFDTNVLVYAYNTSSPFFDKARLLYEEVSYICIAQQNLLELYAIITDKRRIEHPVSQKVALALLDIYQNTENFTLIHPNAQTPKLLYTLMQQKSVNNTEIFDTYLVATMLTNNVKTIYTADEKVFKKFNEIQIINPFIT